MDPPTISNEENEKKKARFNNYKDYKTKPHHHNVIEVYLKRKQSQ